MKLEDCLAIGHDCGLTTISECYMNIELHAMSLFVYSEINKELSELQKDIFYHHSDEFVKIFNCTLEEMLAKGWKRKEDSCSTTYCKNACRQGCPIESLCDKIDEVVGGYEKIGDHSVLIEIYNKALENFVNSCAEKYAENQTLDMNDITELANMLHK